MAKLTIYKVASVVYDIYCKSQINGVEDNKTAIYKILEYHKVGHQLQDAMQALGIYEVKESKIIWKANPPTIELIEKINNKRKEIYDSWKAKNNDEIKKENKNNLVNDELIQYKDALEKALLRINELEKKEELKQPDKKSFIAKLFN
jgi:hypothetical protein